MQDRESEHPRIPLPRLYEKVSSAGKSPQHEANHGSIYQRFAARTLPLEIFANPPLLWSIQAIVRSTTHLLGKTWKPSGGSSFCQSTAPRLLWPTPQPTSSEHPFGGGLSGTLHQIHTPPQRPLHPILALVLSCVTCVQPQVPEAGKSPVRPP
jgi:hypothetical protein